MSSALVVLIAGNAMADGEAPNTEGTAPTISVPSPKLTPVVGEPPAPAPNVPQFFVTLDQLAQLTYKDPLVAEQLSRLIAERQNARSWLITGLIAGGGALGTGLLLRHSCGDDPDCDSGSRMVPLGIGLVVLGILGSYIMSPTRAQVVDVVNTWNGRHPTQPIYPH